MILQVVSVTTVLLAILFLKDLVFWSRPHETSPYASPEYHYYHTIITIVTNIINIIIISIIIIISSRMIISTVSINYYPERQAGARAARGRGQHEGLF